MEVPLVFPISLPSSLLTKLLKSDSNIRPIQIDRLQIRITRRIKTISFMMLFTIVAIQKVFHNLVAEV